MRGPSKRDNRPAGSNQRMNEIVYAETAKQDQTARRAFVRQAALAACVAAQPDNRALPVQVSLDAFSPFIPYDAEDSGLPVAILRYRLKNPTVNQATVSIGFAIVLRALYCRRNSLHCVKDGALPRHCLTRLQAGESFHGRDSRSAQRREETGKQGNECHYARYADENGNVNGRDLKE